MGSKIFTQNRPGNYQKIIFEERAKPINFLNFFSENDKCGLNYLWQNLVYAF